MLHFDIPPNVVCIVAMHMIREDFLHSGNEPLLPVRNEGDHNVINSLYGLRHEHQKPCPIVGILHGGNNIAKNYTRMKPSNTVATNN